MQELKTALIALAEARDLGGVTGWERSEIGHVDADDVLGVDPAKLGGHERARIAALGAVALIAETLHQLSPGAGHPPCVPARPGQRRREPEAWQRRGDDVECIHGVAAVGDPVDQPADEVDEFDDRAWPAVGDDQRQRRGLGRADVQEVHVLPIDVGGEL